MPFWFVAFDVSIGLVGYLWIGYLLTDAIRDARDLDVRRAGFVAGLAVLPPMRHSLSMLL